MTFFVRSQYADEARRGFELVALRRGALKSTALREFTVVSSARDLAPLRFDQVYLTVPATGLLGPWLAELVEATGEATVVVFPTGTEDVALLRASGLRDERRVQGLLSLVSYAAPLPGETRFSRQSTAYWFPPLSPTLFSGPGERTSAVITALRQGGLPARHHRDVVGASAFPTAAFMVWLLALESAGWSFSRLFAGEARDRAARGVREAIAVLTHEGARPPLYMFALKHSGLLRFILRLAAWVVPFPLERYVRQHFTKVGAQTRRIVEGIVARGVRAGLRVDALVQLTEKHQA